MVKEPFDLKAMQPTVKHLTITEGLWTRKLNIFPVIDRLLPSLAFQPMRERKDQLAQRCPTGGSACPSKVAQPV